MGTSPVDQIKEKLGIVEIVSAYVKLDRAGNNLKGKCPFHNEKTPSFFVSPERNFYYCFGCGAKGDIFNFVQEFEGLDFKGALKVLAEKAGVELRTGDFGQKNEKDHLYSALEMATVFYQNELQKNKTAKDYLLARGLTEKTIKDWKIGFAPDAWRELRDHLHTLKFTDSDLEKAGLIKTAEGSTYDRFRGRIMFPLFDSAGRPVAFSGRILKKDDKAAKYINSPETALFSKSDILYGFDQAKNNIRKFDFSILVEGQMDLLMSQQAGFTNTVASSGTALTASHLHLLKRLSNRIIMAFDSDNAGLKAATRAWKIALSLGMEVKVAQIPEGFDPADLILKDKEAWKTVLKEAMHIIDFHLNKIQIAESDSRKLALKVKTEILPYLVWVDSRMEQSHYVAKIATAIKVTEESVWEDLRRTPKEDLTKDDNQANLNLNQTGKNSILKKDTMLNRVWGMILWQSTKPVPSFDLGESRERLKKVVGNNYEELEKIDEDSKKELVFQAEVFFEGHKDLVKDFEYLIADLEEDTLKKQLADLVNDLHQAEKDKQSDQAFALLTKVSAVTKTLNDLKNKRKDL